MKYLKATHFFVLVFVSILFLSSDIVGQTSSYDQVYNIFQTNCDGSSCHREESSNDLKLTDSTKAYVYDHLINIPPQNPYARDSSGNKIIDPFNPANSYLLRKVLCNRGPEPALKDPDEGYCMPDTPPNNPVNLLESDEVDLIRIWIAGGAPDTGMVSGLIDLTKHKPVVSVFPNPFSNNFSVTFSLDQSYAVKFELYDLLGKQVSTLKDAEALNAGDYRFNLRSPEELPSGTYFLRMSVGNATSSTRVVKISNQ